MAGRTTRSSPPKVPESGSARHRFHIGLFGRFAACSYLHSTPDVLRRRENTKNRPHAAMAGRTTRSTPPKVPASGLAFHRFHIRLSAARPVDLMASSRRLRVMIARIIACTNPMRKT